MGAIFRRYWIELVAVVAFVAASAWILFSDPVPLARDNTDFLRAMYRAGLAYPAGHRLGYDTESQYLVVPPGSGEAWAEGYFTSASLVFWLAARLDELVRPDGTMDIRAVGTVNLSVFSFGLLLCLVGLRAENSVTRIALSAASLFVFLSTDFLAYANSLYAEFPGAAFLVVALGAFASRRLAPRAMLAVFVAASALFITAKPQYAPCGVVLAAMAAFWTTSGKVRLAVCLSLLALSIGWTVFGQPKTFRNWNLFNLVFYDVLKHSPDQAADMQALGIDPQYTRFIGYNYFDAPATNPERDAAIANTSHIDVVLFMATHPTRIAPAVAGVLDEAIRSEPEEAINRNWLVSLVEKPASPWPRLREFLPPDLLVVSLALSLLVSRRRDISLAVAAMVIIQIAACAFGEGEFGMDKHVFLLNVLLDTLVVLQGAWVVAWIAHALPLVAPHGNVHDPVDVC